MSYLSWDIEEFVREFLAEGESILHSAAASLSADPAGGERWLLITDNRALVVHRPPGKALELSSWEFGDIRSVELMGEAFGDGVFVLVAAKGPAEQLRFSSLDRSDFEDAERRLAEHAVAIADSASAFVAPDEAAACCAEVEDLGTPCPRDEPPMAVDVAAAPTLARSGEPAPPKAFFRIDVAGETFRPGERVQGHIVLGWPRGRGIRGVRLRALFQERTHITVSHGKSSTTYYEHNPFLQLEQTLFGNEPLSTWASISDGLATLFGGGTGHEVLEPGVYRAPLDLTIPAQGLPSYEGSHADIRYDLTAYVDIPAAFDLKASVRLQVTAPPWAEAYPAAATDSSEKKGWGPTFPMRLLLQEGSFRPGGRIAGSFFLENPTTKRIRGVSLRLVRREEARAKKHERSMDRAVAEEDYPEGTFPYGKEVTFDLPAPDDVVLYRGAYSSVNYFLQMRVDVAWSFDPYLELPIASGK